MTSNETQRTGTVLAKLGVADDQKQSLTDAIVASGFSIAQILQILEDLANLNVTPQLQKIVADAATLLAGGGVNIVIVLTLLQDLASLNVTPELQKLVSDIAALFSTGKMAVVK